MEESGLNLENIQVWNKVILLKQIWVNFLILQFVCVMQFLNFLRIFLFSLILKQWMPPKLEQDRNEMVEMYFSEVDDDY